MHVLFFCIIVSVSTPIFALSNFRAAKAVLPKVHEEFPFTLYCGCRYQGNSVDLKSCGYRPHKNSARASRLEWEHVVPAHAFGQAFVEWREGSEKCVRKNQKFKGRKCARKNPLFAQMEGDLNNLWPEIGELNGLRSNFSMAAIDKKSFHPKAITFGECKAVINERKFEPRDEAKGIVARTYLYMETTYPGRGIISNKNEKLFEAWNKMYPVTKWECKRAKIVEALEKRPNPILQKVCGTFWK